MSNMKFFRCRRDLLIIARPWPLVAVIAVIASLAVDATATAQAKDLEGSWVRSESPQSGEVAGQVPGACGSATLNQNTSFAPGAGIYCFAGLSTAQNSWARAFSIAPDEPVIVNCVDFGVDFNTGGAHTVTVRILTGNPTGPYGSLALLGSLPVTIANNTFAAVVKADFAAAGIPVVVPPGTTMVVEVFSPSRAVFQGGDGGAFVLAANNAGQSAPSYIRAPLCGQTDFVDLASLGFPDAHVLIRADIGPLCWSVVEVENNSGQDAADLHLTFAGTGGTVIVPPGFVLAPGCPNPVVPSNGQVTNTVVIDWGTACVPAGRRVLFLLATPFGPVNFVGGFWTDVNGQNIGDIAPSRVDLVPCVFGPGGPGGPGGGGFPNPGKPLVAIKRQIRYSGNPVYGPWAKPPGQCWQRWCCFPAGALKCYDRWIFCRFPNFITRFFEIFGPGAGNCRVLRGWRKFFENDEVIWNLQVTTIPPPPWEWQNPPGGGPPQKPLLFGFNLEELAFNRLEVKQSDDAGESSYESADFASSFFDVFFELGIPSTNPALPPILGFQNLAQAMAPRYHAAADALIPLETELLNLQSVNAHPLVPVMLGHVQAIRVDLHAIGNALALGIPPNPSASAFFDIAQRLPQLGNAMFVATGNHPRYATAAAALQTMADGMLVSGQMVLTGLPTPVEQDAFLWGQIARFRPMSEFFAKATLPHVQIPIDLGLTSWSPDTGQVHVIVRDAAAPANALIHQMERINQNGQVLLDGLQLDGPNTLHVWIKAPTHLASSFQVPNADGLVAPVVSLVNGDADGNNCIDFDDINFVLSTQGMGGEFAPVVPSSDVNRNGVVSFADLQIVQAGLGQCGAAQPLRCIGDPSGDGVVNGLDLAIVLGNWNTGGPIGDLNGDGIVNGFDLALVLGNWGPCPQF